MTVTLTENLPHIKMPEYIDSSNNYTIKVDKYSVIKGADTTKCGCTAGIINHSIPEWEVL